MQLVEVLKTLFIHPQSGVKYTSAPLGTRAIQLKKTYDGQDAIAKLIAGTYFNGKEDPTADWTTNMSQATQKYYDKTVEGIEMSDHLQFLIGFSTTRVPFYQFQLMKDATALQGSAIYAREQAVINRNSLSDLCTKNSVSVSPLESIIEGKRHCGVLVEISLCEIDRQATAATVGTPFFYKIPSDITFSGILDLNQLNPIFNSFPVLTRIYTTLHRQL
ncbi:MAG: hypothetical protein EZS28_033533 [Streblomastix strix]|uniref:Uncharacterized protein n=1 Tax=Streblomastix strix TaxID=222440 RepID=A0A5J4UL08_9EUKA|nr:MAG: hypothetical protein EZS28_033533 [Streblomastix strix]